MMKKVYFKQSRKSFTLIEILVVAFIIVLLVTSSVLLFNRTYFERRQNDQTRQKLTHELAAAIEEFKADKGHYPYINWYGGQHAYQFVSGTGNCAEAINPNYSTDAMINRPKEFKPGTNIWFTSDYTFCDDLSMQLLGKAYLPEMPQDEASGQNVWKNPTNPKKYIDEIPKDPNRPNIQDIKDAYVCLDNCPSGSNPTSDYNPNTGYNEIYKFFYDSYVNCPKSGLFPGSSYWINSIMQLKKDGLDNGLNLFVYEYGPLNEVRKPANNACSLNGTTVPIGTLKADFTYQVSSLDVSFNPDTSTAPAADPIKYWNWDFGDGNQSFEHYPTHPYPEENTYTVTLIVGNNSGWSIPVMQVINVDASAPSKISVSCITEGRSLSDWSYGGVCDNVSLGIGGGLEVTPNENYNFTININANGSVTINAPADVSIKSIQGRVEGAYYLWIDNQPTFSYEIAPERIISLASSPQPITGDFTGDTWSWSQTIQPAVINSGAGTQYVHFGYYLRVTSIRGVACQIIGGVEYCAPEGDLMSYLSNPVITANTVLTSD